MQAQRLFAWLAVMLLAASFVAADHYSYSYPPYGDYGSEYSRSRSTESVTIRESESHHERSTGGRYYHATDDQYDYGRSRDFSFSRTYEDEHESHYSNAGYAPYGYSSRGQATYSYPYDDVGTSYGRDYRPFSDYYEMSVTSPYYNPARYSRVGNYASRYLPYGY